MTFSESALPHVPPASARNAEPILGVLRRVLPASGLVLEIASGAGYHAAVFADAFPNLTWQPSDPDPEALTRIAENRDAAQRPNLQAPMQLDVTARPWPVRHADAVVCINMIHISPWSATENLFTGAAELLAANNVLVTYGPYAIDGDFLAESNVAFDANLKARNPAWGIRDVRDVSALASRHGFTHEETVRMPANNLMLVFRRG